MSRQKIDYVMDEIAQLHMLFTYPRVIVENGKIVETKTMWSSDEAKQLCQRLEETLKQLFEDAKQNKREYDLKIVDLTSHIDAPFKTLRPFDTA